MFYFKISKRQRSGKKGAAQIDWAISLGFFLMFLAFFFVFITPQFTKVVGSDSLTFILENHMADFEETVERIPLTVDLEGVTNFNSNYPLFLSIFSDQDDFLSDISSGYNYAIRDFVSDDSNSNNDEFIYGDNKNYAVVDSDMIFLANLSSALTNFMVYKGKRNYTNSPSNYDLHNSYNRVDILKNNFYATFSDDFVKSIGYMGDTKINSVDYYLNSIPFSSFGGLNHNSSNFDFGTSHYVHSDSIDLFSSVFANNDAVFNKISLNQNMPEFYTFNAILNLTGYSNFYVDTDFYGRFNPNETKCYQMYSDSLILYNNGGDRSGVAIKFDKENDLNLCSYNGSDDLELSFSILVDDVNTFDYYFFSGDYKKGLDYFVNPKVNVGLFDKRKGISLKKLKDFKDKYNFISTMNSDSEIDAKNIKNIESLRNLKESWGFPNSKDFGIIIRDITGDKVYFDFKTSPNYPTVNINAKEVYGVIIDKYGEYEKVIITYLTW